MSTFVTLMILEQFLNNIHISIFLTWQSFPRDVKPDICKTFLIKYKSFLHFYLPNFKKSRADFIWLIINAWIKDCRKLEWCSGLVIQHRSITSIFWNKGQGWQLFNFSLPQRLILIPFPLPLPSGLLNKIISFISHAGSTMYTRHASVTKTVMCPYCLGSFQNLSLPLAISLVQDLFNIQKDEAQDSQ